MVGNMTMTLNSDLDRIHPHFTLTCVTQGGPATSVHWIRGGALAGGIKKTVLDDPVTAQYTHTLTVKAWQGGLYKCIVSNDKPSRVSAYYQGIYITGACMHACCKVSAKTVFLDVDIILRVPR